MKFKSTTNNNQQTGSFVFPNSPNVTQSTQTVLIATQAFADLPGAPTPDFIMPREMIPITGKVCFKGNPENSGHFGVSLCLSRFQNFE